MDTLKLYHGDCLEIMSQIPDGSVDMVLCDLPYGTTKCSWDIVIPFDKLWAQYKRVCKPKARIVLFATEPFTSRLILSNVDSFREKLTWQKHKPSNFGCAKTMHLKYTEDIVVFGNRGGVFNPQKQPRISPRVREAQKGNSMNWCTVKKDNEVSFGTDYAPRPWTVYDAEFKYPGNVVTFPAVVSNSKEKVNHPSQKPVDLLRYLIRTYTNEDEVVLDNTMGSGSTGVAALLEHRDFIGIELNDEYFGFAQRRIQQAAAQLPIKFD